MRGLAVLLCALAATLAACGSGGREDGPTVFAAASLSQVLPGLDPEARFNFAGSDQLARQIREGTPADVYASASARYPEELLADGLVEEPRVFATNVLVVIVPKGNPAGIRSVADLRRPGTKVVLAAEGVPAGDYARQALAALGAQGVLANVASEEQDVAGVVAKVALGAADAGFAYATDAVAAAGRVEAIELPAWAQPRIEYVVAFVAGSEHPQAARAFVGRLLGEEGRAALAAAGFGLP